MRKGLFRNEKFIFEGPPAIMQATPGIRYQSMPNTSYHNGPDQENDRKRKPPD